MARLISLQAFAVRSIDGFRCTTHPIVTLRDAESHVCAPAYLDGMPLYLCDAAEARFCQLKWAIRKSSQENEQYGRLGFSAKRAIPLRLQYYRSKDEGREHRDHRAW